MAEMSSLGPEYTDEELEQLLGDDPFDGWDDDPAPEEDSAESDTEDSGEKEEAAENDGTADQPDTENDGAESEAEPDETGDSTEAKPEQKPETPAKYTLKHLDDTLEMTAEEMIPLAQKGLDYDKVRQERDSYREQYPELKNALDFCNALLKNSSFDKLEDMIVDTYATMRVRDEKRNGNVISHAHAKEEVRAELEAQRKGGAVKASPRPETGSQSAEPKTAETDRRDAEIQTFFSLFDDQSKIPQFADLPVEVRSEFEKTGNLVKPWVRYQMRQKDAENETLKRNAKNRERSTGSRKSAGKSAEMDPMFDGWED